MALCQSFEINPSHNQQAASHDFKHLGETDFEDCFNVFAFHTAFHVADMEENSQAHQ